jgi:hypothetical protein
MSDQQNNDRRENLRTKGDEESNPDVFPTPGEGELPERIASVEPWEEGSNTRGFQHGGWDYLHATRDEAGPAATEPGNEESGES